MLNTKNPLIKLDVYKTEHARQYPEGTTYVCANHTPRKSRIPSVNHVVFFGVNNMLDTLYKEWEYFSDHKNECLEEYEDVVGSIVGVKPDTNYIRKLYRLAISVSCVPEGTLVPIGVPTMVISNTEADAFFLPQMIETNMSTRMWSAITSATIAVEMRKRINEAMEISGGPKEMIPYLNHDFSYRGMNGEEAAIMSGLGHLVGSSGTDTVVATMRAKELYGKYYGNSIAATEHSVMCVGGKDTEFETFSRLLDLYPDRPIAVVSDTWDLWKVLSDYLPRLGDKLTNRTAPLVIRPDSGDPVKILMGDKEAKEGIVRQGVVPYLMQKFGWRYTYKNYRLLPSFLGTVYGDAMSMERCDELNALMLNARICPSNTVRGIGSFTYQYNTRDTFGQAFKATEAYVNGSHRDIFKDPVTDSGEKKSLVGKVGIIWENGKVIGSRDRLGPLDDSGYTYHPMTSGNLHLDTDFDAVRKRTGVW